MKKMFSVMVAIATAIIPMTSYVYSDEAKKGGTLRACLAQTPRHLNPAVQSGIVTGFPGSQLFATPIRYDENWDPQPYLAKSWEVSDDGLTVTLYLEEDAVFHDGVPIKSSDIAFSLETIKANHPFKTMFAPVMEVQTPDEHTAVLKLSQPHPALFLADVFSAHVNYS